MKKFLKGFTLVEILIVIVIIGILIGALVPRMSAAQGRARDVARKNDLSNLQAAILVSYQDKGRYPCSKTGCKGGNESTDSDAKKSSQGIDIDSFEEILTAAGMNSVPTDPMASNKFRGVGGDTDESDEGQYRYITAKSNGIEDGGFFLMAKTEVEGSSNWVVCQDAAGKVTDGLITSGADVKSFVPCGSIKKAGSAETCKNDSITDGANTFANAGGECLYKNESELRYVIVY